MASCFFPSSRGQDSASERDGIIVHEAIVGDDSKIAIVGQYVMEMAADAAPLEDGESNVEINPSTTTEIVRAGQYMSMDNDYQNPHTLIMGNQMKSGGVSDTSMTKVWDMGNGQRLVFFDYSEDEFQPKYVVIDESVEERVKDHAGLNELPDDIIRSLQKVEAGFLLGGYTYREGQDIPVGIGDVITLYDASINQVWELSGEMLSGGRYKGVVETEAAYVLYGDAKDESGNYIPSICSISKTGDFMWRHDSSELTDSVVSDGTLLQNGNIAFVVAGSESRQEKKTGIVQVMNAEGTIVYSKDLFQDHLAYNPTSVIEINERLAIVANHKTDNQAVLLTVSPSDDDCSILDITKDRKCIRQITHLIKESEKLAHAYGYLEYDDSAARDDASQKYQSFIQTVGSEMS